jgi:hypothetical protein
MSQVISNDYLEQQRKLHEKSEYGVASLNFAPIVAEVIRQTGCRSVSDYGAGKKRLLEGLKQAGINPPLYFPYDPAFPEYGAPKPADLVCCIDVLEHIEPEFVDNVIADLSIITTNLGFFSIHMGPAGKMLSDGRNAHLIQRPGSWWLKKLTDYFEVLQLQTHQLMGRGIWLVVTPRAYLK